ncbi:Heavy metal sensor histidine kinase [Cupriavidus sp. U2]|uniref:heavy metal sensor histidine kinase n=1 Tax=Cupriavidus sp. U2 TaxID=2920269 RepID=UPI0020C0605B|nr:heavy metal sensor histidine kinase [Cupriavidus sp. U2]KAI3590590.1 Heavy metal sensor histidine kinase [Cupriavidus sp. U2]
MTARRHTRLLLRSLTARLAVAFALIAGCAFAGVGLYLYRALATQIIERDDSELLRKAVRARAELAELPAADAQAGRWQEIRGIVAGNEEFGLRLLATDGALLTQAGAQPGNMSAVDAIGADTPPSPAAIQSWETPGAIPARGLAMQARLGTGAGARTVRAEIYQVAASRVVLLRDYRLKLCIAACLGALGAGLLGYAALHAGMAPLRRIAAGTASVTFASGVLPVDPSRLPAELDELASALQRMIDRLRERYERLSQFSADLAHDFRTPIGNLLGQTQVALSSERSVEEYQALLASNVEEYERLSRMIENMLFLARADNAQVAMHRVELDLPSELARQADYFELLADARGIAIHVDARGTLYADATLFRRALGNLLSNAVHHSPESAVIALRSRHEAGTVVIEVANHGPGIAPEHLPRLFDRFFRGDPARANSGESSGIGLAIVKTIMELHHGAVQVESVPDDLTTFRLVFPGR